MSEKDVLCPICGEAVNPNWFVEDEKGRRVHVHCYTIKDMREVPKDPSPPKGDT